MSSEPKQGISFKPIIVLVSICAIAGVLLGVVHPVTAPVAAAIAEQRAEGTVLRELMLQSTTPATFDYVSNL